MQTVFQEDSPQAKTTVGSEEIQDSALQSSPTPLHWLSRGITSSGIRKMSRDADASKTQELSAAGGGFSNDD